GNVFNGHIFRLEMDDGFDSRIETQIPLAQEIGAALQPGERVVLLREHGAVVEPRLYLFYGKLPGSVYAGREKRWSAMLRDWQNMRLRGVVAQQDFAKVQQILPSARVISQHGDLIHWTNEPSR